MRSSHPAPVTPDTVCRRHVEALARSGQTVPVYARAHGLKPDTLYRWRRRFPAPLATHASPDPTPVPPPVPRLVPVTFEAPAICELVLRDGLTLRLPTGTAPALVVSLVRALEAR